MAASREAEGIFEGEHIMMRPLFNNQLLYTLHRNDESGSKHEVARGFNSPRLVFQRLIGSLTYRQGSLEVFPDLGFPGIFPNVSPPPHHGPQRPRLQPPYNVDSDMPDMVYSDEEVEDINDSDMASNRPDHASYNRCGIFAPLVTF